MNAVVLIGNLTTDPDLRTTPGGVAVCNMRIAVNGREKVNGNWTDRADFFDITAWGNTAENCAKYLNRGSPIAVSGKLRLEQWEKDGQKHSRVKITAEQVQFLSGGRSEGGGSAATPSGEFRVPQETFAAPTDDEIPF